MPQLHQVDKQLRVLSALYDKGQEDIYPQKLAEFIAQFKDQPDFNPETDCNIAFLKAAQQIMKGGRGDRAVMDEGAQILSKLVAQSPANLHPQAYFIYAQYLGQLKDTSLRPQIEKNFQKFLNHSPNSVPGNMALAKFYYDSKNWQAAIKTYQHLIAMGQNNADMLLNLCRCYLYLKELNPIKAYGGQLTSLYPDFAGGWFICGNYHELNNDRKRAYGCYAKACRLDGKNTEYLKARHRILVFYNKTRQVFLSWLRYERAVPDMSQADRLQVINDGFAAKLFVPLDQYILRQLQAKPNSISFRKAHLRNRLDNFDAAAFDEALSQARLDCADKASRFDLLEIEAMRKFRPADKQKAQKLLESRYASLSDYSDKDQLDIIQLRQKMALDNYSDDPDNQMLYDYARAVFDDGLDLGGQDNTFHARRADISWRNFKPHIGVAIFDFLLALKPGDLFYNLSRTHYLGQLNRPASAALDSKYGLKQRPNDASAHRNLSIMLLHSGRYLEGFAEYQWRWKLQNDGNQKAIDFRNFLPRPPLQNLDDARGKRIFLHSEQGYGDVIQFLRYVPLLAKIASEIRMTFDFLGHGGLNRLAQNFKAIDQVVMGNSFVVNYDYQASLLDLPYIFKTEKSNIPPPVPFSVPAQVKQSWQSYFKGPKGDKIRIGIVAEGNRINPSNRRRTVGLRGFADLFALSKEFPNLEFYCLQKEIDKENRTWLFQEFGIDCLADRLSDFADTAAAIDYMDLVISVDTSVAHLAANQGKPTWILTSWRSDWRWGTAGRTTKWYPTVRLFRQHRLADWSGVLGELTKATAKFCRQKNSRAALSKKAASFAFNDE